MISVSKVSTTGPFEGALKSQTIIDVDERNLAFDMQTI